MSGFYLITRGITRHHLFKGKPERLAVWMWILDNAAWKDTTHDVRGKTIQVPRGAVCASLRTIAEECGVGVQVVRTAINRFQSEHMVNTQATHGKTVISLCNYEKHQAPEKPANTIPNTPLTRDQHTTNTQKKQGNKGTKVRETNVSLTRDARDDEFSQFWACVPRKVGKGAAEKAFAKARKIASLSELIDGMRQYAHQRDGQDAKYTCHPSTWLNEKRWLDEHQHTQADFHREIDRMLGDSDGLQRTDQVDHHEPQRLSAPVSAPAPSGHGREPDRGEGDCRGNQQSHLSLVKPRRFGGTG